MFGYPTPKREHYRIPTAEDTASKLAGKSVFSILGEKDGFWHPSFWGKRVPFALLQDIKRLLTNASVLKLFDSHKEVVIETDISKDGLCAFLLQEDHPLAYDSRS